ncbi:type II toxin-antitoxin system Phd/YefM family antitoxin [bacterium]|nr:type II toxin-antitoxin system Phd/YefM family antitoxin [bacterium]
MAIFNIHEAKTHFSKILGRVENGEEIIIARAGKPVAIIESISSKTNERIPGSAKGLIVLKKDFCLPLPDSVINEFEK